MHIIAIIIYLLISYLVGLLGKNRKFGFYGYFFISIFITPLVGLLLVLASDSKDKKEDECA
ncbi:MAG: Unknown protein [uncultured Sulfurovum sp.]|uniref:Uncharacterized protein n=1 Tax=uncultured Sulfurovum sp. TaxID=269237 RepID=A0A6S6SD54_9BACT|nr:MAG: Unknown protein [uncultured Sulfurovum sp.]